MGSCGHGGDEGKVELGEGRSVKGLEVVGAAGVLVLQVGSRVFWRLRWGSRSVGKCWGCVRILQGFLWASQLWKSESLQVWGWWVFLDGLRSWSLVTGRWQGIGE